MRLFVALDLPATMRAALVAWADAAAPASVRRVVDGNLHVTLAFLGSRGEDEADAVAELLPACAREIGVVTTAGALWLPPRRPGVLSVALRAPAALGELHAQLVERLVAAVGFEPELRVFRPHVTVGRVARGTRIETRRPLDPPPPELDFRFEALTLYRSHTGRDGARYEPLAFVGLRG